MLSVTSFRQSSDQWNIRFNQLLMNVSKYNLTAMREKQTMWIMTRSDTIQAVQLLEMARGLKLCIEEVEVFYYPRSWSAFLFSHMQNVGFLTTRLIYLLYIIYLRRV